MRSFVCLLAGLVVSSEDEAASAEQQAVEEQAAEQVNILGWDVPLFPHLTFPRLQMPEYGDDGVQKFLPLLVDVMNNVTSLVENLTNQIPVAISDLMDSIEETTEETRAANEIIAGVVANRLISVNQVLGLPIHMLTDAASNILGEDIFPVNNHQLEVSQSVITSVADLIIALACEIEVFIFTLEPSIDAALTMIGLLLDQIIVAPFNLVSGIIAGLIGTLTSLNCGLLCTTLINLLTPLQTLSTAIGLQLATIPTTLTLVLQQILDLVLLNGTEIVNSLLAAIFGPFACPPPVPALLLADIQSTDGAFVTKDELKRLEEKLDSILNWIE